MFKDDDLARAFSRFPQGLPSQFYSPVRAGPLVANPGARSIVPSALTIRVGGQTRNPAR